MSEHAAAVSSYWFFGAVLQSSRELPFEPAPAGSQAQYRLVWDAPSAPWVTASAPTMNLAHVVRDASSGLFLQAFVTPSGRALYVACGAWHALIEDGVLRCTRASGEGPERGPPDDAHGHALAALLERVVGPLAAILLSEDRVVLHGNAVALGPVAWVFVGPSGAGKSTTTLFMLSRGARLLCDDRVPCVPESGLVEPGPSAVRVAEGAPLPPGLRVRGDEEGGATLEQDGKRALRLAGPHVATAPVIFGGIVLLAQDAGAGDTPTLEAVGVRDLTFEVLQQSFSLTHPSPALRARQFRLLTALARGVRAVRWRYRPLDDLEGRMSQLAALYEALAARAREA